MLTPLPSRKSVSTFLQMACITHGHDGHRPGPNLSTIDTCEELVGYYARALTLGVHQLDALVSVHSSCPGTEDRSTGSD